MDRPKLVQSLDCVYTYTEILLIYVSGNGFIDYMGRPEDADGPKTVEFGILSQVRSALDPKWSQKIWPHN